MFKAKNWTARRVSIAAAIMLLVLLALVAICFGPWRDAKQRSLQQQWHAYTGQITHVSIPINDGGFGGSDSYVVATVQVTFADGTTLTQGKKMTVTTIPGPIQAYGTANHHIWVKGEGNSEGRIPSPFSSNGSFFGYAFVGIFALIGAGIATIVFLIAFFSSLRATKPEQLVVGSG